jgi:outer membrane lipoprotein carrier protein
MNLRPIVLLVPLMLAGAHEQTPQPSAPELARALQKKYETVRDFSADFVHVYEGGILRKRITERGTLLVKKPGKMRWAYTSPEQKLFVSDGVKMYSYIPQDRQVIVSAVPTERQQDYDWLVLVVDRQSLRVRELVTNDAQGGQSTFTFSNLKENVGLSDKEFTFKIPRGVDVVTDGRRSH